MQKTTYQRPEIRDSSDSIVQSGAYGKNTAFCNGQNTGIFDYINNNLEWLSDNKANNRDVIKTTGGTITGTVKAKNPYYVQFDSIQRNVAPAAAQYRKPLIVQDANGSTIGQLQITKTTTNSNSMVMAAFSPDGSTSCSLSVTADSNNNVAAYAPAPANTANDTRIATTKWTRDNFNTGYTSVGTSADVSVASGACYNLQTLTLTKGVWVIQLCATFSTNATGYRALGLGTNATTVQMDRYAIQRVQAATGAVTAMQYTMVLNVTSASQSYYLNVYHNAGTNLTCSSGYRVIKLV